MLAYVFWHWCSLEVEETRYLEALIAFHRALSADPPTGFRGSRVVSVESAPWVPVAHAIEDWYFVDDFAALGALNEAAVTGRRSAPHDGAARLAAGGKGGVYRNLSSGSRAADKVTWLSKPGGLDQKEFLARLPADVEVWQRQMVLGPAPEFRLSSAFSGAGFESCTLAVRSVYP
jgi:hypothetical protein